MVLNKHHGFFIMVDRYYKYPSTKHVPWSPGLHRDDSYHDDISVFENREVVVTEKMDGENCSIYADGHYHARSIDSAYHPSRTWMGKIAARVSWQLPDGWRVCGENMYAKHSIRYEHLESYFLVFSIWNAENRCLSWPETEQWCELLELSTVPVLYRGRFDRDLFESWNENKLNQKSDDPVEGYVIRTKDGFHYDDFATYMAKWVREDHVQTDQHWMEKEVEPNELKNQ